MSTKPVNVLFAAQPDAWEIYDGPLQAALEAAGVTARIALEMAPEEVEYIIYAPNSRVQDFSVFPNLKAVLNLWAGVEGVVGNETLTAPLARMVDPAMTQGMTEWVVAHVMRHHAEIDRHILGQDGVWRNSGAGGEGLPLAPERKVTVLGLGALGTDAAEMLVRLGFDVTGWSRSQKDVAGVRCLAGAEGLVDAMTGAEIIVLLVPYTAETENVLNAERLALLAPGAVVINPGRGPLIDDEALFAALESGQVGHATLDVFRVEPLPPDHPYWAHPRVTVTPHIASETRATTASEVIAQNIRRGEAGEALLHLVNRTAGY